MPSIWAQAPEVTDQQQLDGFVNDPRMKTSTKTALADLVARFAFPWFGIFVFGSGSTPDYVLHVADFPSNPPRRADRQQTDMEGDIEAVYKDDTATDDDGNPIDSRGLWINVHIWNYVENGVGTLRRPGVGHFAWQASTEPPGNWWQPLN